jgi:hypothetical protein
MLDIGYLLLLEMCGRGIFCSHSSDVGSHSSDQSEVRSSAEKLVHIQKSDTFTYAIYYHNETMTSPHKVWASDDVSQTLTILWAAGEHQMHVETTLRNVETKCMWRPPTEMWRRNACGDHPQKCADHLPALRVETTCPPAEIQYSSRNHPICILFNVKMVNHRPNPFGNHCGT